MATGYKTPSVAAFPADLFPVEGDRSYAVRHFPFTESESYRLLDCISCHRA